MWRSSWVITAALLTVYSMLLMCLNEILPHIHTVTTKRALTTRLEWSVAAMINFYILQYKKWRLFPYIWYCETGQTGSQVRWNSQKWGLDFCALMFDSILKGQNSSADEGHRTWLKALEQLLTGQWFEVVLSSAAFKDEMWWKKRISTIVELRHENFCW